MKLGVVVVSRAACAGRLWGKRSRAPHSWTDAQDASGRDSSTYRAPIPGLTGVRYSHDEPLIVQLIDGAVPLMVDRLEVRLTACCQRSPGPGENFRWVRR